MAWFLMSEFQVLKRTEHKNLMKLIEILEDREYFYIICELVNGGDLAEHLEKVNKMEERQTALIIK